MVRGIYPRARLGPHHRAAEPLGAPVFLSKVLVLFQRRPSQIIDLDPLHVERAGAGDDALGGCGGEPCLDQLGEQFRRIAT